MIVVRHVREHQPVVSQGRAHVRDVTGGARDGRRRLVLLSQTGRLAWNAGGHPHAHVHGGRVRRRGRTEQDRRHGQAGGDGCEDGERQA